MQKYCHTTIIIILFLQGINCLAQNGSNSVKPNAGEGIYALLIRNGLDPQKCFNEFIELNKGKFGKNNSLLSHHSYALPINEVYFNEPLLGVSDQSIKIESNELKGALYFLISGHGGPDPGASGKYSNHKLNEDEYAYDITLRLGKILISKGAKVYFAIQDPTDGIRNGQFLEYDNDETCFGETIPLDQIERLRQRVNKVNQLSRENSTIKYQRTISIHLDSRSKKKQIDVFFYYHKSSQDGKNMAERMRQTLEQKYKFHQPSRGFSGTIEYRNLYELVYTRPVSVFIELGNIQNYRDQQRFIIEKNRQALAEWLAEGIVKDYTTKKE